MNSFRESLEIRKTLAVASECFSEMQRRQVDPESFVNWVESLDHSYDRDLVAECMEWLETELRLNEAGFVSNIMDKTKGLLGSLFQGSSKDPLQAAMAKVQDLIKKSSRASSRLSQDKLQSALHGMLSTLKSRQFPTPSMAQSQEPTKVGVPRANVDLSPQVGVAGPGSYKVATAASTAPVQPVQTKTDKFSETTSLIQRGLLETRMRNLCYLLSELGYNPKSFAEWYTSQRELEESWLAGALSGIKGGLAGGWDRIMGGGTGSILDAFRKGYITSRDAVYEKEDLRAIDEAIKHLLDFAKGLPPEGFADVQKQIAELISMLKEAATARVKASSEPEAKPSEEKPKDAPPAADYTKDENVVAFIKSSDKLAPAMGVRMPPIYKKIAAQWEQIEKNPELKKKVVDFTKQELLKKPEEKKNFYAINTFVHIPRGSTSIVLKKIAA